MPSEHEPAVGQPPAPEPDEAIMTMLRLALDDLPAEQRAAIRYATDERLTVAQIAVRLGRTPGETRAAMRDGLTTLRDVLHALDPSAAASH